MTPFHLLQKHIIPLTALATFFVVSLVASVPAFAAFPLGDAPIRPSSTSRVGSAGQCYEEISTQDFCGIPIPNGWSARIETDYITTTDGTIISYDFERIAKSFGYYGYTQEETESVSYPNNRWAATWWRDGNPADSTDTAKKLFINPTDGNLCNFVSADLCKDEAVGSHYLDWDQEASRFYVIFRNNSAECKAAVRTGFPGSFSGDHGTVSDCFQEQRIYYVLDNYDTRLGDGRAFMRASDTFHRDEDVVPTPPAEDETVKPLAKPVITLSGYSGSARVTVTSPVDINPAQNSYDSNGGQPVDGEIVYQFTYDYPDSSTCATIYGTLSEVTFGLFKGSTFEVTQFPECNEAQVSVTAHIIYDDGVDENGDTIWRLRKGSESPPSDPITVPFAPKVTNFTANFVSESSATGGLTYSFTGVTTNDPSRFFPLYLIEASYDGDSWFTLHETTSTSGTIPGDIVFNSLLAPANWGSEKKVGLFEFRVGTQLFEDAGFNFIADGYGQTLSEHAVSDVVTISIRKNITVEIPRPTNVSISGTLSADNLQYSFTPIQSWLFPKHWYELEVHTPGKNDAGHWTRAYWELFESEPTGRLYAEDLIIPDPNRDTLDFRLVAVAYSPWGNDGGGSYGSLLTSKPSSIVTVPTGQTETETSAVVQDLETSKQTDVPAVATVDHTQLINVLRSIVAELSKIVSSLEQQITSLSQAAN